MQRYFSSLSVSGRRAVLAVRLSVLKTMHVPAVLAMNWQRQQFYLVLRAAQALNYAEKSPQWPFMQHDWPQLVLS